MAERRLQDRHRMPLWFKLWFAFCAVLGLSLIGVAVWALITVVNRYAGE